MTHRYLHGPLVDQILADEALFDDEIYWALADNLGTVRTLLDSEGNRIRDLVFAAWGEITQDTNPSVDFPFAFTGREYDRETGLYFYRARYYDPRTGRFISEDPISFAAGDTNLSRYVGNGPAARTDPTGLDDEQPANAQGEQQPGRFVVREGRLVIECPGLKDTLTIAEQRAQVQAFLAALVPITPKQAVPPIIRDFLASCPQLHPEIRKSLQDWLAVCEASLLQEAYLHALFGSPARPGPRAPEDKSEQEAAYRAALEHWHRRLFDYYMDVLEVLMGVGDHLYRYGMSGIEEEFPWMVAYEYNCTDFSGYVRAADGASALRVVRGPGAAPIPFPVEWPRLFAAMLYLRDEYWDFDHQWCLVDRSSTNLHGWWLLFLPSFLPIYLSTESFEKGEVEALGEMIHEPLHDFCQFGFGHDGIKEIVPCDEAAISPFGSDWEQFVWFLKTTKCGADGVSLWDQILEWVGPRPKPPSKP